MKKFIEEGMKSFYKNKGKYINPYKRATKEHNAYERGWTQALKRCPEWLLKSFK